MEKLFTVYVSIYRYSFFSRNKGFVDELNPRIYKFASIQRTRVDFKDLYNCLNIYFFNFTLVKYLWLFDTDCAILKFGLIRTYFILKTLSPGQKGFEDEIC